MTELSDDAASTAQKSLGQRFRSMFRLEFLRFLLVGAMNTAFSYFVYAGMLYIGMNFALANLIGLVCGIFFSFRTQGTLVFDNPSPHLFYKFVAYWAITYACNLGLIKLLLMCGINQYLAGAAAVPILLLMSYFVQKYSVFRKAD